MMEIISARTKKILILFYVSAAFVVGMVAVDIAQSVALDNEPDPLTVEHIDEIESFTLRTGEEFIFNRTVCVYKDLTVIVHREFHNLETGRKHMMPGIAYVAYAEDGCYPAEFAADVPQRIPPGRYEYRPILIYQVNERRQIAKPAPYVKVEVIE